MPNRRTKLAIRRGGVSDDQRLKKWSPRSRNGCTTCRLRRVKCDEAKPICAQCVMAQRHCAGSFYQDAARSPPINQSVTDTSVSKAMKAPRSVKVTNFRGWELAPGGWEMIEAFEYLSIQIPFAHQVTLLAMNTTSSPKLATSPGMPNSESFLARIIADKLVLVCCSQQSQLVPSNIYGVGHLWVQFRDLLQRHFNKINHDLTHVSGDLLDHCLKRRIWERICDLMEAEHVVGQAGWRGHLDAYFALMKRFGIPNYAVVGNSVSSLQHQLFDIYDFDDDQITDIFGMFAFTQFPCPSKLFAEIVAINRLRMTAASLGRGAILPDAKAIFGRLQQFEAKNWQKSEKYKIPDLPQIPIMARIFELAVSLYAIQALRLESATTDGRNWPDTDSVRSELIALMRQVWKSARCTSSLVWPAAVAGASLDKSSAYDQEFIANLLRAVDSCFIGYGIAVQTYSRLQDFWLSEKTGWEWCWSYFYLLF